MSIIKFLNQINTETFDKEGKDQFLSRKDALGKLTNFSKNLALSAVPLGAIAAFSNPAVAQSSDRSVEQVLNYALTLEYLESEFYNIGSGTSGLIPSGRGKDIYDQVTKHENQHVDFLTDTINSIGGTPVEKPTFDFTVGGAFDPFNDYAQFLILSQAFEDTGVRAYKGQAGFLQGNAGALTAALQIHSVEARHASAVRRLRGLNGYITQDNSVPGVAATDATYAGEDQLIQLGIDTSTLNSSVSADAATEAWDEPLGTQAVLDIAGNFIVS